MITTKKLLSLLSFAFVLSSTATFASPEDETSKINGFNQHSYEFLHRLAQVWAPEYYALDVSKKVTDANGKTYETGDPANAILDPEFDGDSDWTNNGTNVMTTVIRDGILQSKYSLKAKVLYSVIATSSHFYISYMKYNALDRNESGKIDHEQDAETSWVVVRRTPEDVFGTFEFVVVSAHNFPMIYVNDEFWGENTAAVQKTILNNALSWMNMINRIGTGNPFLTGDAYMSVHHKSDARPEFVPCTIKDSEGVCIDPSGKKRGLKTLVARGGHSLCKFDSKAECFGPGTAYVCTLDGQEGETYCYPVKPQADRIVRYSLMNIDQRIQQLYPLDEESLLAKDREALKTKREKIFEGNQKKDFVREIQLADGRGAKVLLRPELPEKIARGRRGQKNEEPKASALLFNAWNFKWDKESKQSEHKLAIPHDMHAALVKGVTDPVSGKPMTEFVSKTYEFNVWARITEIQ